VEIIEDGVDGVLVPQADIGQLQSAMFALLKSSDRYLAEMCDKAQEKAYYFTKERIVREVEAVFEEVLTRRSKKE